MPRVINDGFYTVQYGKETYYWYLHIVSHDMKLPVMFQCTGGIAIFTILWQAEFSVGLCS